MWRGDFCHRAPEAQRIIGDCRIAGEDGVYVAGRSIMEIGKGNTCRSKDWINGKQLDLSGILPQ